MSQLPDGRIIRVVNGNPQGYICGATKDPLTDRIILSASKIGSGVITDTFVSEFTPTINYSTSPLLQLYEKSGERQRIIIKCAANKTLNLLLGFFQYTGDTIDLSFYEVDPTSFDIATVTWNTQPTLGALIGTQLITEPIWTWKTFSTGTKGAFLIKATVETGTTMIAFTSSENSTPANRPYIT